MYSFYVFDYSGMNGMEIESALIEIVGAKKIDKMVPISEERIIIVFHEENGKSGLQRELAEIAIGGISD